MANVNRFALAGRFSRNVHQAPEVGSRQDIGLGLKDAIHFLGNHRV